jgi:hypothetical protein
MNMGEALQRAALQRIAEQEARIARQKELIAKLDAKGRNIAVPQRLLAVMEDTLTTLRASLGPN